LRIEVSIEHRRMCGWRHPDKTGVGIYLIGRWKSDICERLPVRTERCAACGCGWMRFRAMKMFKPADSLGIALKCKAIQRKEDGGSDHNHGKCPVCNLGLVESGAGMIWIGEKFYGDPSDFLREAMTMGVSRKVPAIPIGFEVGKTWVFVAHARAFEHPIGSGQHRPGIFAVWKPSGVDLVVEDEKAVPKRAERIAESLGDERCRIVRVVRAEGEQTEIGEGGD